MDKVRLQPHHITSQLQYEYILGPIKIKDGLFMGDELAAKDIEFILTNKVTHVINTVSRRIPNIWEKISVQYLSYNWTENEQNIFDKKNNRLNEIYNFIEQAMEQGESCLVHSVNAKSRAFVVVSSYMMKKYAWSLEKTLEYITLKKPQLDIRQNFYYQLKQLEGRLCKSVPKYTSNWQESLNEEDLVLRNTYINSKAIEYGGNTANKTKGNGRRVTWLEAQTGRNAITNFKDRRPGMPTYKEPTPEKKVNKLDQPQKSILKGSSSAPSTNLKPSEKTSLQPMLKPQQPQAQPQIINNINGNVIHVTVNNFITADENPNNELPARVPPTTASNPLMTRPFSSDARQRQKKKEQQAKDQKKVIPDSFFTYMKSSPYEPKYMTTGSGKISQKPTRPTVNMSYKEPTQFQTTVQPRASSIMDRPPSASNTDKKKLRGTAGFMAPGTKQQLMVVSSNKKTTGTMGRYPSPMVPKQSDNLMISSSQYKDKWRGL